MTDDLYERYKESLRVGHVAVLRGSLEAAVDAYRTAAEIAPSRALPHTSLGGVLLRLGKLDDALVEFAAAVARAPRDEGALLGQAEALGNVGRREEAAKALDQVAELQAESGRLPEAADTLRRAIELHDSSQRAERQQELVRQVRLSAGDHAAEQLLARALRLRDESVPRKPVLEPAVARVEAVEAAPVESVERGEPAVPLDVAEPAVEREAIDAGEVSGEAGRADAGESAAITETAASGEIVETAEEERAAAVDTAGAGQPASEAPETESRPQFGPATLASRLRGWRGWWGEESERERQQTSQPSAETGMPASASDAPAAVPSEPAAASGPARDDAVAGEHASRTDVAETMPEVAIQPAAQEPATPAQPETDLEPAAAEPAAAEPVAAKLEPVGVMARAGEARPQQPGDELLAAAEAADLAGDGARLRTLLLDTARAYGAESRYEAAIDAANRVIRGSPSDLEAHLVLVELYTARDWNSLAAEKLELLARLTELSGDEEGRQRVCAAASVAFPKDERFDALCQ